MKLIVTRTVIWVTTIDGDSYPGMTPEQAIMYEKNLPLEEVTEFINVDDDAELMTHVRIEP
jgi:hypothetical protein